MQRKGLTFIGMPGSGKSTVAKLLAHKMNCPFIDTDTIIESNQGMSLQDIVTSEGMNKLQELEEAALLLLTPELQIISTGGSVIYTEKGMKHLQQISHLVYLKTELKELEARIDNFDSRGMAIRPDQTFKDLYQEREPLYLKYADSTIETTNKTPTVVMEETFDLFHRK